jgi:proline iminopeptidase
VSSQEPQEGRIRQREVVAYDQLGCGRSDIPDDDWLWEIGRFADEVDEVRFLAEADAA